MYRYVEGRERLLDSVVEVVTDELCEPVTVPRAAQVRI